MKKIIAVAALSIAAAIGLTGCATDADTVSYNLSQDAEQFKIERRITAVNGINGDIIVQIQGKCSAESAASALDGYLELTCKVGPDDYFKNYVRLGDQDSVSIEQVETTDADEYHYTWIIKPESILPNVEIETGAGDTGD